MASIETLVGKAKRDKKGNWIWNGESYDEVLLMIPYLKSMSFSSTDDALRFEQIEKEWKAAQIKNKAKASGDSKTVSQVNKWQKNSRARHDDMGGSYVYYMDDTLSHAKKGEEQAGHKYTARKWVKGKWQYIYDAIGGDEKRRRDTWARKAESDKEKSKQAEEVYRKNRYDDHKFRSDLRKYDYDPSELDEEAKEYGFKDGRNYMEKAYEMLYDATKNPSQFNMDEEDVKEVRDTIGSPTADGARLRELDAKLYGDKRRKAKAEAAANNALNSASKAKAAQLEYDKTLLGKVEKGLKMIDKLFKRK